MKFDYQTFERCFLTALKGIVSKQQIIGPAGYQAAVTNAIDVATVAEERLRQYRPQFETDKVIPQTQKGAAK